MTVTYQAVVDVSERSGQLLAQLLRAERVRRGTRTGTRALGMHQQAVGVLRWFFDDVRMVALAQDNKISRSAVSAYRDEGIAVLAARRPSLHGALLAAKAAGHAHVIVDGTLIETDRLSTPGPTPGVDLWWSGKHKPHGDNIQVVADPDGWPRWTCAVRPGREHDLTAAQADPNLLPLIDTWVADGRPALADLGYEGIPHLVTLPIKTPRHGTLTADQRTRNRRYNAQRAIGERAHALLKTTFKVLRRYRGCPWRLGDVVAAALVLLHLEHHRTT